MTDRGAGAPWLGQGTWYDSFMESIEFRLKMLVGLCWAFFAICTVAVLYWLRAKLCHLLGLPDPDWGTWFGSIGAVGAMLGTIWIATAETRRREAQEDARSYIVAAALAPRLQLLGMHVGSFEARLTFVNLDSGSHDTPENETRDFLTFQYIDATTEELIALATMPNNCATKLAYAQGQLTNVRAQVALYVTRAKSPEKPLNHKVAAVWLEWVRDLHARINVLERQCTEAAKTHAAPPTQYELHGEDFD